MKRKITRNMQRRVRKILERQNRELKLKLYLLSPLAGVTIGDFVLSSEGDGNIYEAGK